MDCSQTLWLSDEEYRLRLNRKLVQLRVPLRGSLDLTRRCNLRCVHCYLGPRSKPSDQAQSEMTTGQVLSTLDAIVEAGCLFLLLTGGEPLLRPDFRQVYRHAKKSGLLVTVFSNGTLISDEILDLFAELPPLHVEITLYGATAATYERITGVPGSYARCLSGINRLLARGIRVKLKTVLMTLNSHEFFAIERMAQDLGVDFRFDAGIFPCFNGERGPLALRLTPGEVWDKEAAHPDVLCTWREYYQQRKDTPATDDLYPCGAGLNVFHIDACGNLLPCVMTQRYRYDLLQGSFADGWRQMVSGIRVKKASRAYPCNRCHKRTLCGACPAFFDLENGSEELPSEFLCTLGQLRYEAIQGSLQPR